MSTTTEVVVPIIASTASLALVNKALKDAGVELPAVSKDCHSRAEPGAVPNTSNVAQMRAIAQDERLILDAIPLPVRAFDPVPDTLMCCI
jgi:hypothetical protein